MLGVDWRVKVVVDGVPESGAAAAPPPPEEDPRDDEPHTEPQQPSSRPDPEKAAIELLESTLGARRMDQGQPGEGQRR